jgi:hypothetical protein
LIFKEKIIEVETGHVKKKAQKSDKQFLMNLIPNHQSLVFAFNQSLVF